MTAVENWFWSGSLGLAVGVMVLTASAATPINWVGAGADNLTTTPENWQYPNGSTPSAAELEVALTNGTLAVSLQHGTCLQFADGTWFNTITNDLPQTNLFNQIVPFTIGPTAASGKNGKLILSNGLTSYGKEKGSTAMTTGYARHAQLVIKGHWALPEGVDGGEASFSNPRAFKFNPSLYNTSLSGGIVLREQGAGLALILDNATIDMPFCTFIMINGLTVSATNNSVNVFNGPVSFHEQKSATHAASGAEIIFNDKVFGGYTREFFGPGKMTFNGRIDDIDGVLTRFEVTMAFNSTNNIITGVSGTREGLLFNGTTLLECNTNDCFCHNLQIGYNGNQNGKIELHQTTQQVGRASLNSTSTSAYLHGDYGSMLEVNGTSRSGVQTKNLLPLICNIPVNGGVGFHIMCAANQEYVFSGQKFASCGDQIVSGGTNRFASGASWLNGTNFVMKGTGVMAFAAAGQVNRKFAEFHFSDSGKVYIPSGVTLEVACAVIDGATEKLMPAGDYDESSSGDMAGRVVGGGVLTVLNSSRGNQTYVETFEDMTKDADWTVEVGEGCTNVVKVTQTNNKIIKKGRGVLVLNAANSVSGIDIEAGYVAVGATGCLGEGTVTIAGQRSGYSGPCGLWFCASSVSNAADVVVNGNTTIQWPAFIMNSTNNTFSGSITAEQDLMLLEEFYYLWQYYRSKQSGTSGIWSTKVSANTSMNFLGPISVAGTFHLVPDCDYNFCAPVTATIFESRLNGDRKYQLRTEGGDDSDLSSFGTISFYSANKFNEMRLGYRGICGYADEVLGGAMIGVVNSNELGSQNSINKGTSHIAGIVHPVPPVPANDSYSVCGSGGLIITGSTENVETYTRFFGSLNLFRLDAAEYPGYTMTLRGRNHSMIGDVDINDGTLVLTNDARFSATPSLRVGTNGKLVVASTDVTAFTALTSLEVAGEIAAEADIKVFPSSLSLTTLKLSSTAQLNCQLPTTISASYCYLDGMPACKGSFTHANFAAIPEGVTVNVTSDPRTFVTAVWTGKVSSNMSNPSNWLVDDAVPAAIDLVNGTTKVIVSTNGTKMIPDADNTRVHSITVQRPVADDAGVKIAPFTVGEKGRTLIIDYQVTADSQAQLRIQGTIATPWHLDQGLAVWGGDYTISHTGAGVSGTADAHADTIFSGTSSGAQTSIPLLLDDATVEKPMFLRVANTGGDMFYALPSTTNILAGAVELRLSGWHCMTVGAKGVAELRRTLYGYNRLVARGEGELRIVGADVQRSSGFNIEGSCTVIFDTTNAVLGVTDSKNLGVRIGESAGASLRFGRSYGFKSNGQEQLDVSGTKNVTVDFGVSTQRFARARGINTGSTSVLTGKYGSMLEVEGGTGWTESAKASNVINPMQITMPIADGLGVHYLGCGEASPNVGISAGSEETFTLAGKAFQSCGNLEVSAGTLELASDATWLNGTNFVANGTGTLKFTAANQVNSDIAALHLAGDGKVEIPSGITLKVATAETNGVELANGNYTSEELGSFITGAGTLKVVKKGTTIMLW